MIKWDSNKQTIVCDDINPVIDMAYLFYCPNCKHKWEQKEYCSVCPNCNMELKMNLKQAKEIYEN